MDAPGQGTASRDLRFLSEFINSSKSDDSLLKDKLCAVEAMHRRMVFEGINEIGLCDSYALWSPDNINGNVMDIFLVICNDLRTMEPRQHQWQCHVYFFSHL